MTAPLWFKAPFKILRLFVREKLRERVFTVSIPQLSLHVPRDSLPVRLGGTLEIDHPSWLLHCYRSMTNREDEIVAGQQHQNGTSHAGAENNSHSQGTTTTMGSGGGTTTVTTAILDPHLAGGGGGGIITDLSADGDGVPGDDDISDLAAAAAGGHHLHHHHHHHSNTGTSTSQHELWSENPPSSASSGFSDDDSLAGAEGDPKTIEQIVQMVRERGKQGLIREYAEIKARAPDGTFTHAKTRNNLAKNRYTDVLCYDHSRVVLSQEDEDPTSDYINANFVDGYKQKNAYISTQGPLPKTSS